MIKVGVGYDRTGGLQSGRLLVNCRMKDASKRLVDLMTQRDYRYRLIWCQHRALHDGLTVSNLRRTKTRVTNESATGHSPRRTVLKSTPDC